MSDTMRFRDGSLNIDGWSGSGNPWEIGVEIIDRYAGFEHRVSEGQGVLVTPPTWLRETEDRRRVISYRVARAALEGVSRYFHDREGLANDYDQTREHGHAAAYVERLVDAILGEEPSIRVPGADVAVPPRPVLPRRPEPKTEGGDEIDAMVDEAVKAYYLDEAKRAVEEWQASAAEHPGLVARQARLERWALDTRFWEEIYENESEHVVPLGDGVLEVSIGENGEPRVQALAPDGFQKVWTEASSRNAFPDRVNMGWEIVENSGPNGEMETWVRRVTYELLPVTEWKPVYQDRMATKRCFYTDAWWRLEAGVFWDKAKGRVLDLDEFSLDSARFEDVEDPFNPGVMIQARQVPLPIDYIPVVHVQHTLGRWGRSAFARVMALLDDMAAADTATALVAILCGEPPLLLSGGPVDEEMVLGAATAISLGDNGKGAKIGFSEELRALIEYGGSLERQFIKMTSLSSELSGRENREQSGRAIGLKMTPFRQTILRARLARRHSYVLLLKMVQRMGMIAGTEGFEDPVLDVELKWGTFIPEDLSELVAMITLLRDRGLLTNSDVYDLLTAAGLRVKDVDASLEELRSMDVRVAQPLMEILGRKAAALYLNREFDEEDPSLAENAPAPEPFGGSTPPGAVSARANPGSGDRNPTGPRRQRSAPTPNP